MFFRTTGVFFLFLLTLSWAQASQNIAIPDELRAWVPWVLEGKEEARCPFQYKKPKNYHCAWPETLFLDVYSEGGSFNQTWIIYEKSWIALPGSYKHWPQDITVDGRPVVVTDKKGIPHIQLKKGRYQLSGRFIWNDLPAFLDLPKTTGLIHVVINNKPVDFPRFATDGRLWLNKTHPPEVMVEDRLQVDVFRRVIDDVPLRMLTRLELNVGGQSREIVLGPLFENDAVPVSATGPLPMRLEVDGKLRIQVRPGRWVIQVRTRYKTSVNQLSLVASNLPDTEVWVFETRPSLRLVEIEGVVAIDPRQTKLPRGWQSLPAYRVTKPEIMKIVTIRRGDPEPVANELMMERHLWLDFSGKAYTFQDKVTGQMRRDWRLSLSPDMHLGRAEVNGVDQLVTSLKGETEQGIEVRQGAISIHAEGRYQGDISRVPAVGWMDNFSQVQATLHLPPGWRLFTASGADSVGGASWLDRWTLLDIFLVLIAALAVLRLFGSLWGAIALACFVFSWHENGAPQFIWLFVIATIALLRVAPAGRLRSGVVVVRYLSLLVFVIIAIPYLIDTVRTAIHPQLEQPSIAAYPMSKAVKSEPEMLTDEVMELGRSFDQGMATAAQESKSVRRKMRSSMSLYSDVVDPHAKVQTGPGLPEWNWSSVPIRWNGPVQQGQMLELSLIPPILTTTLKLICVILVLLLSLRFAGITLKKKRMTGTIAQLSLITLLVSSTLLVMPQNAAAAEIPSPKLLQELQQRLLAPPKCLPQCAQISRMKLDVQADLMKILLEVHASEEVAIPVPSQAGGWMPNLVMLDGQWHSTFRGADHALWIAIPKGKHQIKITGPIRSVRTLQLPLPLQPKHIDVTAVGWVVKGVHQDGSIENVLHIERDGSTIDKTKELVQTVLPPFVTVSRTLRLGVEWRIETVVTRVSPVGSVITLDVPLMAGESVTSEGIRIKANKATIQFSPQQRIVRWDSLLQSTESIVLHAAETLDWVEQWRLDVSPMWHVELTGIPQIHHQSKQGTWFPQWHPWPGEALTIRVSKPAGVEGKTLTIDRTHLTVKPGLRANDVSMAVRVRSSQAGQHVIRLPAEAVLGTVKINGESQPIRQEEGGVVRLPIAPGLQNMVLAWQAPVGIDALMSTPHVDLGLTSVNANIEVQVPRSRWVLFTLGPQLGPAVLFWGVLIVVVIIAMGLGRTRQTPLKTHQWILLGMGLSQALLGVAMLVVAWLFAMGWRQRWEKPMKARTFNIMQVGLAALTLMALLGLVGAVGMGLLGHPDMQISGNGSSAYYLKWYADQSPENLPTATLISAPMWLYRGLMLLWSLWLAFTLLGWLKWAWQCFSTGGVWQTVAAKKKSNNIK